MLHCNSPSDFCRVGWLQCLKAEAHSLLLETGGEGLKEEAEGKRGAWPCPDLCWGGGRSRAQAHCCPHSDHQ